MEGITTEQVLQSFQADFGNGEAIPPPSEPQNQDPPPADPTPTPAPPAPVATDTPAPQPEGQTPPPAPAPAPTPDNKAFAAMRVQNKQMQELLAGLAKQQGITGTPDEIMAQFQERMVLEQAKKDGIPDAVAKELNELRARVEANTQQQVQQLARVGFQNVKTKFGLDAAGLEAFAVQLIQDGKDPFKATLDLEAEYLRYNYTSEIQKAEARGAAAEAERRLKIQQQGTTPPTRTSVGAGAASSPQAQVTTVKDLEAWMAGKI
jgi:hypothetical protein